MIRKTIKRVILFILAVICVLGCLPAVDLSVAGGDAKLTEGVYRIRNVSNGLYLGAYTYSSKNKTTLRVFTGPYNAKDEGQIFVLKNNGNDCWTLTPKNDKEQYYVCYEKGTDAGAQITKSKKYATNCLFDIIPVDGYYTIAPSDGDNVKAVMAVGTEYSKKNYFCKISDYVRGDATQQWVLEPIEITGITVAYTRTTLKTYTTGTFYAATAPSGEPADAEWKSSDDNVILVGENGDYCALNTGKATVTATKEGYTASFEVTVTDETCFTWYSQNTVTGSDWNASLLTSQYWYSGGVRMRLMLDHKLAAGYDNWMDTGCAICCIADVLHNMNAKMKVGYDFRTAQSGYLDADPYTVCLANTHNREVKTVSELVYGNPTYVAWKYISDEFFVDDEPMSCRKVYSPTRTKILKLLQAHPQGIIAEMTKGSDSHYVVISECINPTQKVASKLEFRIYDPAAYYEEDGKNVLFSDSTSYNAMTYRYGNITGIVIYDTVSNIDK